MLNYVFAYVARLGRRWRRTTRKIRNIDDADARRVGRLEPRRVNWFPPCPAYELRDVEKILDILPAAHRLALDLSRYIQPDERLRDRERRTQRCGPAGAAGRESPLVLRHVHGLERHVPPDDASDHALLSCPC